MVNIKVLMKYKKKDLNNTTNFFLFIKFFILILILITGILLRYHDCIGIDLSKMPSKEGDVRFNNYILEHGYKYFTSNICRFTDTSFFYPEKGVLGYSDTLLGSLPLYVPFRIAGFDRYTAFQLWFLLNTVLNYLSCFYALKKITGSFTGAITGSFLFSFSLSNVQAIWHPQMIGLFPVPLFFFFTINFIEKAKIWHLSMMVLLLSFQTYIAVYSGFFLFFCGSLFFIIYLLLTVKKEPSLMVKHLENGIKYFAVTAIGLLSIFPLMKMYYNTSKTTGFSSWDEISITIPRLSSYFYHHGLSSFYTYTISLPDRINQNQYFHVMFTGFVPYIITICLCFLFFVKKDNCMKTYKRLFKTTVSSFLVIFIFTIYIDYFDFSFYRYLCQLPGLSSIRIVSRIILIETFFLSLLTAVFFQVLKNIVNNKSVYILLFLTIIIAIAIENMTNENIGYFNKSEDQRRIECIKDKIKKYDYKESVLYYSYSFYPMNDPDEFNAFAELDAMIAAQDMGIRTVNGYSGRRPPDYPEHTGIIIEDIRNINNWFKIKKNGTEKLLIIPHCEGEYSITGK